MEENSTSTKQGLYIFYGALSYFLWGILPIYWKWLISVPSLQILAHRILWSFFFVLFLVTFFGSLQATKKLLREKQKLWLLIGAAIVVTINWGTYIWAVNAGHIIDTSLGYYINPLVTVLFAVIILKEKLNTAKIVALILATVGVLIMAIYFGRIPWLSLVLAISFAIYGLIKKIAKVEAMQSLLIETMFLSPFTLIYIIWQESIGNGVIDNLSFSLIALLLGAGVVTATPLLLFAKSAEKVELSTLGFLQYIAPTMTLILGTFVYHENFSFWQLIGFSFIWLGLIFYSFSNYRILRKEKLLTNCAK